MDSPDLELLNIDIDKDNQSKVRDELSQFRIMLNMNDSYLNDIHNLQRKYKRAEHFSKKRPSTDTEDFHKDIKKVSNKIKHHDDWHDAVELHVLKNDSTAVPFWPTLKSVKGRIDGNKVVIEIIGDVTSEELRKFVPEIRNLVKHLHRQRNRTSYHKVDFDENTIRILKLRSEEKSYSEISKLLWPKNPKPSHYVRNYIRASEKRIEKTYASK